MMKLLWVAIRDIEDKRAQQRAKTSHAAQERTCTEGSSNAPNSKAGTPRTVPSAFPAGST